MITEIMEPQTEGIRAAAAILREGGLVAIPTETVYGLAANALNPGAVAAIFEVKGRPQDNPLIVHIAELSMLPPLVREVPKEAEALADAFWPGPLTIIFPKSDKVPGIVTAGLKTVAVRMPSHPVARAVIREADLPLAAPSANRSGCPSPTTAAHCLADLSGRIPLILDGGACQVGVESTVVTLADGIPRILRPGVVTPEDIRAVLGAVEVDDAVYRHLEEGAAAASPGMKYRHYTPKAQVILLEGDWQILRERLVNQEPDTWGLVFDEELATCPIPALGLGPRGDSAAHAHRLFAAMRELDDKGAKFIYARVNGREGADLAVYNRMIRAAGFSVIKA